MKKICRQAVISFTAFAIVGASTTCCGNREEAAGPPSSQTRDRHIAEYVLDYRDQEGASIAESGSSHEMAFRPNTEELWITGQMHDSVIRTFPDGQTTPYFLGADTGPHGIVFDSEGRLWVALEYGGRVVEVDAGSGRIVKEISLADTCTDCLPGGNPGAHGLALGPGRTLWYTGKEGDTIGRIAADGVLRSFPLPHRHSKPIYITAGPDGAMWFTELTGNRIGRIDSEGKITEFPIPTSNSRPIALVQDPGGQYLWFTEESTGKLGRIGMDGHITEVAIPRDSEDYVLASLTIDKNGDFWVEQYINPQSTRAGFDHIINIGRDALQKAPAVVDKTALTIYDVPTPRSIPHRIQQAPNGMIWFTEVAADRVGAVVDRR